jgi:hypothetical protein
MCNIAKLLTILHITWHLNVTRSEARLSILNLSPPSEMPRLMVIISIGRALRENLMTRSRSNIKARVN